MSAELSAYIQEWFKKADNDLRNAEILLILWPVTTMAIYSTLNNGIREIAGN